MKTMFERGSGKGQVWYTDFMVALLIFVIALLIYYAFQANISTQERDMIEELLADAKAITTSLITEGNPSDWVNGTAIRIGLTDGNMRVNQSKIDAFYDMDYDTAHRKFGTRFNHFIFFENSTEDRINITGGDVIGMEPVSQKNMVQIERLLIYNSSIIKMRVQVWN